MLLGIFRDPKTLMRTLPATVGARLLNENFQDDCDGVEPESHGPWNTATGSQSGGRLQDAWQGPGGLVLRRDQDEHAEWIGSQYGHGWLQWLGLMVSEPPRMLRSYFFY
ncbi:unnamed protein product [Fusarium venenatum]|uniref:Uncharacterized protein n=1 Tax=Fusarium venenatum TaxID=56646 RepID=A0A2L2TTL4_9HYPO|nr:uncharacterized protein FVRRES_03878 [Fusarium venenatum]CEI67366.1 unnamed protein product [Fusarium venenatum]